MEIFLICFSLSVLLFFIIIPFLKIISFGQEIRLLGPQKHFSKKGTPTMGGVVFIIITLIVFMVFSYINNYPLLKSSIMLIPFFFFGIIGLADDYIIIKSHSNEGLSGKIRIILELLIAFLFVYLYHKFINPLDVLKFILSIILLISSANAVNLSDGLDGLSGGLSVIALCALAFIAQNKENEIVMSLALILIGILIGYLMFNFHPAKIFMGDVGSLSIGGILGSIAIMLDVFWIYIIIMGVFVLETLSVIVQVLYFKKTRKRIFKMAPLHHHFELLGYSERKIVFFMWLVGIIFGVMGVLIYGISI